MIKVHIISHDYLTWEAHGSQGIELMYVEDYNFDDEEFSVEPIRKP